MNQQLTEADRERAVRAIFESSGIESSGEPSGELLHDAVLVFSHRDGMEPFEWVLSQLLGSGSSAKPAAKVKVKKPKYENVEEPGDSVVSDEAIIKVLAVDGFDVSGASSKEWAELAMSEVNISKGGFYVRLPKLAASDQVLVNETKEKRRIFGREVIANVKTYYNAEALKAVDKYEYERVLAAVK